LAECSDERHRDIVSALKDFIASGDYRMSSANYGMGVTTGLEEA
jgi:hypothetical protein